MTSLPSASSSENSLTFEKEVIDLKQSLYSNSEYGTKEYMNKYLDKQFSKDYGTSAKNTKLVIRVLQLVMAELSNGSNDNMNDKLVFLKKHLYGLSLIARNIPFRGAFSDNVELLLNAMQTTCLFIKDEKKFQLMANETTLVKNNEDEMAEPSLLESIKIEITRVFFRTVQNYSEAIDMKCPQYYRELIIDFILDQLRVYDKSRHTTILMCTDFLRIFFSAVTHQAHVNSPALLSTCLYLFSLDVWSEPEESEMITLVSHIALISLHKRNSYSSIQFELLSSSMYNDDQDSELETGPIEKLMKEVCDFSSIPIQMLETALNKLVVKLEKNTKNVQEDTFEHTSMALSHLVTLTNPKAIPSLNSSLEVHWRIFERVFKVLQNRIRTLVSSEKTKTGRTLVLHLLKSCRKLLQNNNFDIFLVDDKLHEERKPVLSEFLELIQNGLIIANNSGKKVFRKKVQLYASKLIRCFMTFCSAKYIDQFAPKNVESHQCFIINNPLIEAITERALWFEVHAEYIHLLSEHYGESSDEKLKDVMECVVTVCTQFISKVKDNAKNVLQGHSLGGGRNRRSKRDYDDDDEEEEDYRQIKFTKKEVSRAFNALTISLPNIGKELFTTHYQDICQTAFFFMEKSLLTVGVDSICLLSGLIKAMKRYDRELLKKEIHTFVTKVFPLIKGNYKEDEITMMENKEEEDGDFETEIALTSIDFYHTIFVDSEIREILLAKSPNFVHSLYTNLCNFVNKECSYELESLERVEQSKLSLRVLEAMVYSSNPEVTKLVKASDIKGFVISHLDGIIRSFKTDKDYHKIAKYLRALNLFFRIPEIEQQMNKCATLLIEHLNAPQASSSNSSGGNKKQKKKSPTPSTGGNASAQQQQMGKQFKDCCQYIDNLKKPSKTFDEETPLFVRQELSAQSQELIQKLKHWKLIQ
ncbi:hypothetical protein C9374_005783 [Naegleria lovaniensis]|uniref:Uncharacterized protein n=1 Tax=Naegleria lovaniensis TaxID=51637 RepID=A0AA88GJ70_NAELO|nr:uncharacterized protein C9374_005783 [Naegleria lovaniensis]KAG2381991.1 hypothetical protein C9374_005783 [Naegleria lovaniensis]